MPTRILPIDAEHPDDAIIEQAALVVCAGGLVAFPTETVYGLGANGLDAAAVARIYEAKSRPARNPIILHVASIAEARSLVAEWPVSAQLLAERYWPGPLSLALPRRDLVPDIVTAGGPTVAIRWPAHRIAQALIRRAGVPIAAPSANRSGELSPTCAEHVLRGLNGRIDLVLDGGPTTAGIESTVIDLSHALPRLLRPGPIPPDELEAIVGRLVRPAGSTDSGVLPSPGMLDRHYAPRTPLECFDDIKLLGERIVELLRDGRKPATLTIQRKLKSNVENPTITMPANAPEYAERLYAILHDLDQQGFDRILVEMPPETDEWLAVRDRLRRAAVM